jgi:class 3 adenylate cyclase
LKNRKNWLQKPNIGPTWAVVSCIIWCAVILFVSKTHIGSDVQTKITWQINFQVREFFGKSPAVDRKIKSFGFDDSTFALLQRSALNVFEWSQLFKAIGQKQPKAIIVDGVFSVADIPPGKEAAFRNNVAWLKEHNVPIYAGSFVSKQKIQFRDELDEGQGFFPIRKLTNAKVAAEAGQNRAPIFPSWDGENVYGPAKTLRDIFEGIGHIHYVGDGRIAPFLKFRQDYYVPYVMTFLIPNANYSGHKLMSGTEQIPTMADGTIPLNFSSYRTYLKSTKSLRFLLEKAVKEQPLPEIEADDYVYILPLFFTGNVDFKLTPVGQMPAGFAHLAFLNGYVSKDWIKPFLFNELLVILACIVATFIAYKLDPLPMLWFSFLGAAMWLGATLGMFTEKNILVDWLSPSVGYIGALLTVFLEKSRVAHKKSSFVKNAFEGMLAPDQLKLIVKHPEIVDLEARERVVTIVFIDIVGFSLMAENLLPRTAFDQLKDTLGGIVKLVHDHGGIVNKNLGDGLLCFFGYSIETGESSFDHADKAVRCAVEIQKHNLPKTLAAFKNGEPVYPLRIGVNTSSVFLGNLGTEEKLDLTIIGNGVNLAKRLEGACEPHSVNMSSTTKELIDPMGSYGEGITSKEIFIKHRQEKITVYELDPFADAPDLRREATQVYLSSTDSAREEKVWSIGPDVKFFIHTNVGPARVMKFSRKGVLLSFGTQIGDGSALKMIFDLGGSEKAKKGFFEIEGRVHYSYKESSQFYHEIRYINIADGVISDFVHDLKEVFYQVPAPKNLDLGRRSNSERRADLLSEEPLKKVD